MSCFGLLSLGYLDRLYLPLLAYYYSSSCYYYYYFFFFKGKVGATFELLLIIYIFLFFSLYLELAGHNMDKTDCSTEGPLLSEGRGCPSEQTFHQDSFRVKRQTPHMEVVSGITSFLVNVCVFSFVLFKAVCHCCSIRGMYGVKEGK